MKLDTIASSNYKSFYQKNCVNKVQYIYKLVDMMKNIYFMNEPINGNIENSHFFHIISIIIIIFLIFVFSHLIVMIDYEENIKNKSGQMNFASEHYVNELHYNANSAMKINMLFFSLKTIHDTFFSKKRQASQSESSKQQSTPQRNTYGVGSSKGAAESKKNSDMKGTENLYNNSTLSEQTEENARRSNSVDDTSSPSSQSYSHSPSSQSSTESEMTGRGKATTSNKEKRETKITQEYIAKRWDLEKVPKCMYACTTATTKQNEEKKIKTKNFFDCM
ncbi:hypothetical protein RFI_27952 [Reticulomyxa filosa]|uniref:Uncharacterized protein n=1 Tax=Reticulomyxa filosa TaxID=46433 RepID=X6M615_RETFI|nr:hypothetical protein RFI_27952 [Reticulomyxa filosa]|eukprot:ETO09423.1 hypothetical protein RFI_27952 [Reticulomyxa filosa]